MSLIITHSSMSAFKNCRKKYQYRYEHCLSPKRRKESLHFGSAIHKGLELYYSGFELNEILNAVECMLTPSDTTGWDQKDFEREQTLKATARGMLTAYVYHFNDRESFEEIKPEWQFSLPVINPATDYPVRNVRHEGKVDGLFKKEGRWWLREFKTASQVGRDYLERLKLDTQITSYVEAAERTLNIDIAGVIYTILKKPSIKQKQDENVQQFCERVEADYVERPDFYFHQEELFRGHDDFLEWRYEKYETAKDIENARKTGRFYRNTSMCTLYGQCEYMPLCTQGQIAMGFYEVIPPHEELN